MVQEFLKDLEKVVNVDAGTACTEGVKQVAERPLGYGFPGRHRGCPPDVYQG